MTIEFVERLEEGAVAVAIDEVQANPVAIMGNGLIEVEDPELHITGTNYTS
jgi:hypothetical protein